MANVKFYLKDPNSDISLIYARVSFGFSEIDQKTGNKKYKAIKVYTKEKINPKYWNSNTGRVRANFPGNMEYNLFLNNIESAIQKLFVQISNDGRFNEITPKTIREEIKDSLFGKTVEAVEPGQAIEREVFFLDFIRIVIDESKSGERLNERTGQRIQERTIISYNTTINNLIKYETEKKKKLRCSDITLMFYKAYLKYLNDKNFAPNTIGGHIKNIKTFMKIAFNRGLTDSREYERFQTISEESQSIYLNEYELQKIYELDLSNNKRLDQVRDLFIIACFTGLRFSDLKQLKKEHFKLDRIELITIKTQQRVVIPLHWMVAEICNKYEYQLPRVISNQKMNQYLKELGQIAEIDEIVVNTKTKGGLRYDQTLKKYELISVHTARRAFATNMFKNDIPTLSIMKITGHTTERAFLKYIKVSPDENASRLISHPFFNKRFQVVKQ